LEWFDLGALPHPVVPHELFVLTELRDGALPAVSTFGFGHLARDHEVPRREASGTS
jgi:hypothetical protein